MGKMFREIYQIFKLHFRCESRSRPSVDNCKMIWADVGPRMLNPIEIWNSRRFTTSIMISMPPSRGCGMHKESG